MNRAVYIHTNDKQLLGAKLAAFSASRLLSDQDDIPVRILNVDEIDAFKDFAGKTYLRDGRTLTHDPDDLQSFTLARFMVPELMGYRGRAVILDADVFSLAPATELLEYDLEDAPLAACRKGDHWHSSVMLVDCAKLTHWKIADILGDLAEKRTDYSDWMLLKLEPHVAELPGYWNDLDTLTPQTKLLHTTTRLTQPWKTGLPIDFTRKKMPKFFGIIPREPIHKLLGKYHTTYQPHPKPEIETFFFALLRDALEARAVTEEELRSEVEKGHVRPDIMKCLEAVRSS